MKKSSTLAIAIVLLLLAASGAAPAAQSASATPGVDCNPVFKAKAEAGKSVSSKQLAHDLNLPVEQVNMCLRRLRHGGPRSTPRTGH